MSRNEQIERICLSTNTQCNFACRYCYFFNPEKRIKNTDKLSSDEIYTILQRISEYSQNSENKKKIKINFVGSGEPLISWPEIAVSVSRIIEEGKNAQLKFYTVTNGSMLTNSILSKMKELNIVPSISLDGPKSIHNKNRITHTGKGTFNIVMSAIELLKDNEFDVIINTTITHDLINNLDLYFDFIRTEQFDKIIFDRLVDVPSAYPEVSYDLFYRTLERIYFLIKKNNLNFLEIGNFEAYRRSIQRNPDKVCTMFGSVCGAGTSNLMYLQREIYPCGRFYDNTQWLLGNYDDKLEIIQKKMYEKMKKWYSNCKKCSIKNLCIRDCIFEQQQPNYSCNERKSFLIKMKEESVIYNSSLKFH